MGKKTIPFFWKIEEENSLITVSVFEENKSFTNLCSIDGATLQWRITVDGKHDIIARRKGNVLEITGTRFGKKYHKTITIDERPWYQPLSYSLHNFLSSDRDTMSFWVIRADNIEVIALKVKKKEDVEILLNDSFVQAQKVEVRADGLFSPFWHATYWYRKSDKLFLRYQSTHGPPGTDETIVTLLNTPE